MNKTRYLISIFYFISNFLGAASNISLNFEDVAYDKDPKTLQEIALIKKSDVLKLIVTASNVGGELKIDGIENFEVLGVGKERQLSFVMSNKASSLTKYIYNLKPKAEGDFVLGPAKMIGEENKTYKSNSKKIRVTSKINNAYAKSAAYRNRNYFLDILPEKTQAVLGEPIICTARLYSKIPIQDIAFTNLAIPDFLVQELQGARNGGQEDINGKLFNIVEIKILVIPMSVGEKEFPSLQVAFASPMNFGFGLFNIGGSNQFSVESEPFNILVKEIPSHGKNVQFIGIPDKFSLSLSEGEVFLNEPFTLTMQLEGAGNFDYMEAPKIKLDSSCKYFEPSIKFERFPKAGLLGGRKEFNYVIQASQVGEVEIPAQELIYFDTKERKVKKLISNSLKINVKPSTSSNLPKKKKYSLEPKSKDENLAKESGKKEDIGIEQYFKAEISEGTKVIIPFWIFLFMLLISFIFFYLNLFISAYSWVIRKIRIRLGFDSIKSRFNMEFLKIKNQKQAEKLHGFFIDFLSEIFDVSKNEINADSLSILLKKSNLSALDQEQFIQFFEECTALSYSSQKGNELYFDDLLKWAQHWFLLILKDKNLAGN